MMGQTMRNGYESCIHDQEAVCNRFVRLALYSSTKCFLEELLTTRTTVHVD